MGPQHIRLGHALGDRSLGLDEDSLECAVRIVTGDMPLAPRDPVDESTVQGAEQVLGARPRPIYAFVGDLHPDLGSVGLVLSRAWSRRALQGATRCDSGGLFAGKGLFAHVAASSRSDTLCALSDPQSFELVQWEECFADEVFRSYERGAYGYVEGDVPESSSWDDARAHCIRAAQAPELDRRLWTWELRMHDSPRSEEYEALVLSHDAQKRLHALFTRKRVTLPDHVKILTGQTSEHGIDHWFSAPIVRKALLGAGEAET